MVALLGGLAWIAAAFMASDGDLNQPLYLAAIALMVVAFAGMGYALVATAPIWLRAVVGIATPLLGAMVWWILWDSLPSAQVAALVTGVLLLAGGGIGLGRSKSPEPPAPTARVRGRRAAR